MSSSFYTVVAVSGSLLVSFSTLPQIIHFHRRKSSRDMSYTYQGSFLAGTVMFLVYYGYYSLWAVFYPTLLSFFLILYMIGVKIHLESLVPRGLLGVEELGIGQRILTVEPDSEYPSPGIGGSSAELVNTRQDDGASSEAPPIMSSW